MEFQFGFGCFLVAHCGEGTLGWKLLLAPHCALGQVASLGVSLPLKNGLGEGLAQTQLAGS